MLTIIVVIIYLIIMLWIGLYVSKKASSSTKDFWSAGKSVGTGINSFAIMATIASGGTFLGSVGYILDKGMGAWFTLWAGVVVGLVFSSLFVSKALVKSGVSTVPEFLYQRYDSKFVGVFTPIILTIGMIVYTMTQYVASAYIIENVLGISYEWGLIIGAGVLILYTLFGGMHAVTLTDFFQGLMMTLIFGGLVLSVFVMIAGPWAIMNHSVELSPTMGGITDPWITYAGAFLQNVFAWSVIPHTVMRVYSAKDTQTARRSLLWGMLISAIVVAYGGVLTAGVIVLDISYSHPDQALIYLMDAIGPVGLALGSAAILAAIMSSTSGMLLSVSASVSQDLYKNVFKSNASDKSVIKLGRITIAIVGALTVILAFNPPELLVSMYQLVLGFLSAGLFIPLVLGIWWKKANNTGAI